MGERDERVEALVAAGLEPLGSRGGVLGEREAVPSRPFGRDGQVGHRTGVEHVGVGAVDVRILEDELHTFPP